MSNSAASTFTGHSEVDELLFSWARVIAWAKAQPGKFEEGFALSIQRARKRPGWKPSHKQLAVMQQMKARADRDAPISTADDAPDLIEE